MLVRVRYGSDTVFLRAAAIGRLLPSQMEGIGRRQPITLLYPYADCARTKDVRLTRPQSDQSLITVTGDGDNSLSMRWGKSGALHELLVVKHASLRSFERSAYLVYLEITVREPMNQESR